MFDPNFTPESLFFVPRGTPMRKSNMIFFVSMWEGDNFPYSAVVSSVAA